MDAEYENQAEDQNEANRAKIEGLSDSNYNASANPAYNDGGCDDGAGCPNGRRKDSEPLSTPSTVASGGANSSFFPDHELDIRETDILDDDTGTLVMVKMTNT